MKIGVIVAMKSEFSALYDSIGQLVRIDKYHNFEIYCYKRGNLDIYVSDTSEGEIAAAITTQYLASNYHVDMILNFGLCGSLNASYKCADLVMVKEIVHYGFDITALCKDYLVGQYPDKQGNIFTTSAKLRAEVAKLFQIPEVRVASSDKFIGDSSSKQYLIDEFGADICEMESAGIAISAEWNHLPVLLIKCISDNASDDAHLEFRDIVTKGVTHFVDIVSALLDQLNDQIIENLID